MKKARLVEFPHRASYPPHCCIVSGRRDGPVIDFGDLTQKACGPRDPRAYVRAVLVEKAAADLLGMVPQAEVDQLRAQLAESEAERERLTAIVAAADDMASAAHDLLKALGLEPETATTTEEA